MAIGLLGSNFRFLTTGTFDDGFELPPLPKTESDATTTDSVKFDVVNFCPRASFGVVLPDAEMTFASIKCQKKWFDVTNSTHKIKWLNYLQMWPAVHIHLVQNLYCDYVMVSNALIRVVPWMSPSLTKSFLCSSICCYFYCLSFLLYCCCCCYCHHRQRTHSECRCSNCSMSCLCLFGLYLDSPTAIESLLILK